MDDPQRLLVAAALTGVQQKGLTGAACALGIGRAAADRMASEGWSIQSGS
ncbi:MAG: hypothetical protein K0Q84_236 [Arthrobacter sp.]|nr:hypothetical protein [Arthrobacter sp.]